MTKWLRDAARRTHTLKLAAMGRTVINKATYLLVRTLANAPPNGWLHSPWHWYRFPFSLRNHLLWSPSLQGWFWPEEMEERRVGKECRSRWSPYHAKKK